MNKWTGFPFVRYAIALIAGILLFDIYPEIWYGTWLPLALALLIVLFYILSRIYGFVSFGAANGLLILSFLGYLGGLTARLHAEQLYPDHYIHYPERTKGFTGTIISGNSETENYQRYTVGIDHLYSDSAARSARGKLYLYVRKDTATGILAYGSRIAVSKGFFPVSGPKNPDEFDYRLYLERRNIFAHTFVDRTDLKVLSVAALNPVKRFAVRIRDRAQKMIGAFIPGAREPAVMVALLLGTKDQLDRELKEAYSIAGTMHVLAVSGLHVGIVYQVVILLFGRLRKSRLGKPVFTLVALTVIWLYALITGFSPSVMRAATMFSVIIVSNVINRTSNVYNSLGIAAFILLLYDPYFIYSVGFQLSFVAVLGIVYMHPKLYGLFVPNTRLGEFLWSVSCVSVAAQLATFPLTVYYFHQFPTYFLVANLIVIPAATGMLVAGIVMLLAGSLLWAAGKVLGLVICYFVWLVNEGVSWIGYLPVPVFDWLYLDAFQVILIYLVMLLVITGLTVRSFHRITMGLFFFMVFFAWGHYRYYHTRVQRRIVFYEVKGHTVLDLIDGRKATLLIDHYGPDTQALLEFRVDPHRLVSGLPPVGTGIQTFEESSVVEKIASVYLLKWHNKKIIIAGSLDSLRSAKPISADVVLIRSMPNEAFPFSGKQVLIGSEPDYYARERIKRKLETLGMAAHSLSEDGFREMKLGRGSQAAVRFFDFATIRQPADNRKKIILAE